MKLFGRRKRRPSSPQRTPREQTIPRPVREEVPQERFDMPTATPRPYETMRPMPERPQRPRVPQERRPVPSSEQAVPEKITEDRTGTSKAFLLLCSAICLFVCAIAMCLVLINHSAEKSGSAPTVSTTVKELQYVVNSEPPVSVQMPETLEPPKSKNDSERLNIMLIGVQEDTTDALMLLSINLNSREMALVSFPRDIYISGNYDVPKLDQVYREAGADGIHAVMEQVRGMIGYQPDYYFVLDENSLEATLQCTGKLIFELPEKTDYCELSGGEYELNTETALAILSYREGFDDVYPAPTATQRTLIMTLLEALIADDSLIREHANAIAEAATTDLSAQDLAYLGYLLYGIDFKSVYSDSLPGTRVEIDNVDYLEIDPEEAVEILNAYFNPLLDDLTIYTVNFRQKTGDSTEGTFDSYGFSKPTEDEDDETEDEDDTEEATPSDENPEESPPNETETPTESSSDAE